LLFNGVSWLPCLLDIVQEEHEDGIHQGKRELPSSAQCAGQEQRDASSSQLCDPGSLLPTGDAWTWICGQTTAEKASACGSVGLFDAINAFEQAQVLAPAFGSLHTGFK
jgi:hypothetical protein